MDLSPTVTRDFTVGDDQLWLGSKHGTDAPRTITLDIASGDFDAYIEDSAAVNGKSIVPSGLPLAPSATAGLWTVADTVAPDCEGHLLQSVEVPTAVASRKNVGASLLWHGVVLLDEAPKPAGFTAAMGAPQIYYPS